MPLGIKYTRTYNNFGTSLMDNLRENISFYMSRAGLDQHGLAARSSDIHKKPLSQSAISKLLRRTNGEIKQDTVVKVAECFGITEIELRFKNALESLKAELTGDPLKNGKAAVRETISIDDDAFEMLEGYLALSRHNKGTAKDVVMGLKDSTVKAMTRKKTKAA